MKREKREKRARDYFELEPDERILRDYIGPHFLGGPILLTNKQIYYRKGILFRKPCKVSYRDITGISTLFSTYSSLLMDAGYIYLFENSGEIHGLNTYVEKEFKDDMVKDVLEARRDLVPKKDISPEIRVRKTELYKIVKELHGDNLVDLIGPGYYCGRKKGGRIENIFIYTANWIAGVSTKGDVAIPRNEILLYDLERELDTSNERSLNTRQGASQGTHNYEEIGNKLIIYTRNRGTHEFVNLCGNSGWFTIGDPYKTESLMKDLYKTNGRPDRIKCKGLKRR